MRNIRNDLIALINNAKSKPPDFKEGTWWLQLDIIKGKRWAIAISWMDYENTGEYKLYAKIAYQPVNSIMQCDYDIDWIMPYDENTGEVNDTEISNPNITTDVDWLLEQWEIIRKEL